jgi:hypothetical protein
VPLLGEGRLTATCEALRIALEREIGLTSLRIDLLLDDAKVRSFILSGEAVPADLSDPRRMRAQVPARMSVPLRVADRVFGTASVEDDRRWWYPPEALPDLERIVGEYAPALEECLREGDAG